MAFASRTDLATTSGAWLHLSIVHLFTLMFYPWKFCQACPCIPNIQTRSMPAFQIQIRRVSVTLRMCYPHAILPELRKLCCHLLSHIPIRTDHLSTGRERLVHVHLFMWATTQEMNTASFQLPQWIPCP